MTHLTDDQLVLHYYGEDGRDVVAVERHLRTCARCAGAYDALARSLDAVTPPEFSGAIDPAPALRQAIRDRLRDASAHPPRRSLPWTATTTAALVWLTAIAYPLSLQGLFASGRLAVAYPVMIPAVVVALTWACAGPLVSALALKAWAGLDAGRGARARLVVVGAVLAAVTPALFVIVRAVDARLGSQAGLWSWYGVLGAAAFGALCPWPRVRTSTQRIVAVHRWSALFLTIFLLGHVVNQVLGFLSPPSYAAMRSVMRLASEYELTYVLIVAAVAIQLATGVVASAKHVRAGAFAAAVQVATGWYLAAFLLMHVFLPLILGGAQQTVAATPGATGFDLLAAPRAVAQLPFLLLGVGAFLFHLGVYARLAALTCMAEASVRRWSYAGAVVGAVVIVSVGLSLCGIHL
ncbi:MAG TPA: hypothetical protein VG871_11520 [Vicinamibacterales bacterium]|nr:hypothetical protein [Vicinamibacterales bacterium]